MYQYGETVAANGVNTDTHLTPRVCTPPFIPAFQVTVSGTVMTPVNNMHTHAHRQFTSLDVVSVLDPDVGYSPPLGLFILFCAVVLCCVVLCCVVLCCVVRLLR